MARIAPPIAYVCFQNSEPPADHMARAVRDSLGLSVDAIGDGGGQAQSFSTDAGLVSLIPMPFPYPYPASDLTDDLGQRAAWPNWQTEIGNWKSHVIVTTIGSATSFDARKLAVATTLRAASAVARQSGASAVGWSGNVLFCPAARFVDMVAKSAIPIEVVVRSQWGWAGQTVGQRPEVKTRGLRFFELPEIEHPATGEDAVTLYNRVMSISRYMIDHGPILKDGHTLGGDGTPLMRIREKAEPDGGLTLVIERVA